MSLILDKAPDAVKRKEIEQFGGRTVAVDASMAMYQFLISTQHFNQNEYSMSELTDKDGNKTGHLVGLFYRSLTFLDQGIKPIWVFDG
jgi:flap endonuclease-1